MPPPSCLHSKHIYGITNTSPTFIFQGTRHARTPSPARLFVWTGCVAPSNPQVEALTPNARYLEVGLWEELRFRRFLTGAGD